MIYVLGILFVLLAFLLICSILLQEGKGGGLAAMGGAVTDSVMGARNPMRRMTIYFFVCFIVVILALNYSINQENSGSIAPGLKTIPLDQKTPAAATTSTDAPATVPGDKPATTPESATASATLPATPAATTAPAVAAPATTTPAAPAAPVAPATPAATPER